MIARGLAALALVGALAAAPGAGAQDGEGLYADEVARSLHQRAVRNRESVDASVLEYTAVVRQRIHAALRMPLKDRTLYRAESAHRLFWKREGRTLVQVLALREQTPTGVQEGQTRLGIIEEPFDPVNDRLLFGFAEPQEDLGDPDDDGFWFEHPLYDEYAPHYRFISGDTLTVTVPDGRSLRAVELQVVPTVADVHRMTGSLWIEPSSGALVRAVYRLSRTFDAIRDIPELQEEEEAGEFKAVPGLLKPWTAELSMIAVDYALWDFDIWLPRSMRAEGIVAAGILKAPMTIDVSYRMESVLTEEDLEEGTEEEEGIREVHFKTRSEAFEYLAHLAGRETMPYALQPGTTYNDGRRLNFMVPADPKYLLNSPDLPPPIWEDAPGFASEEELSRLFDRLADLPTPPEEGMPRTFRWGLQRPDLVRYNRVEGLSVGARGQIRPQTFLGPLSISATGRFGVADRVPNGRIDITRETIQRKVTVSGFYELAAIDEDARHLGLGNSILGVTAGRDDGDYYRRAGGWIEWTPPEAERRSFSLRAFAERHESVESHADFALFRLGSDSFAFRPNLVADEGSIYGGRLTLDPWWGTDPNLAQGGLRIVVEGGAGDFEYGRSQLDARLVVPMPSDLRVGLQAGAGRTWGTPPVQKLWYVGGTSTLRGYEPRSLGGTAYARARGEVMRQFSFGGVSLFSDWAWAGAHDDVRLGDGLYSIGAGLSILDGLIRMDAAWGLRSPRGFRLDLYLDGIL